MLLVSGKGGVGKSSVSAALAVLAARHGLKALLCELESGGRLAKLFKVEDEARGEPIALKTENLHYLHIDTEVALEEYLSIYMRFKRLYQPIAKSPAMHYFLKAAPGFKELLTVGKIWWEEQLLEGRPKKHRWDIIIVDAPAAGHGISFMGVAQMTVDMVRVGPIKTQAQRMVDALQDPNRTRLVIVTLPEEMPVNESIELANKSRDDLGIKPGPVILNAMPQEIFGSDLEEYNELKKGVLSKNNGSPQLKSMVGLAELGIKRRSAALEYREKLAGALPDREILEIPYLPDWDWGFKTIHEMAECLNKLVN